MDIGTERYLEEQRKRRAVALGLKNGFIYPCERCASTLVVNTVKSDKHFERRDFEKSEWEKRVSRSKGVDGNSVYYLAWGLERSVVVCEKCSDEIENWPDSRVQEEAANWPIG